jgi:hypothetical protein
MLGENEYPMSNKEYPGMKGRKDTTVGRKTSVII